MSQNDTVYDAVVIGAGLSGLAAARELIRQGYRVCVLEARDRVGGRTEAGDLLGTPMDVGGQWVGPTQHRVLALCREFGLETFPQYDSGRRLMDYQGRVRAYRGTIPRLPLFALLEAAWLIRRINRLAAALPSGEPWRARRAAEWDGQTAQDWVSAHVRSAAAQRLIGIATRAIFSCEPRDLSFLYFLHYIRANGSFEELAEVTGGAQQDRIRGGAFQLAQRLAAALPAGVLQLSTPVQAVRATAVGVEVPTGARVVRAQRAIIAMAPALTDQIRFEPGLPEARATLATGMPMGTVIKVWVAYPKPFWREQGYSGEMVSDAGLFSPVFDGGLPGRSEGVLVGFIEGDQARRCAALDPAARREQVIACLVRYLGSQAAQPLAYVEKDWTADPWSRGCYVGLAQPGVLTRAGAALREPVGRLHWAGTETATCWVGYMDGALESGERAAAEVCAALAANNPV